MPPHTPSADLTACAREPIHLPGAIQPHGIMLVLEEPSLRIIQASRNTEALLGRPAEDLLGQPFASLTPHHDAFQAWAEAEALARPTSPTRPLHLGDAQQAFAVMAHRTPAGLIVELEPVAPASERSASAPSLQAAIEQLRESPDLEALYQTAVAQVRALTGFDRAKLYRFDAEWNGSVIAESRAAHMPAYLGLHFPATDIPEQARRLYTVNRLRLIAHADYTPVPLLPALNPHTDAPLDLSHSVLRSVSPVHLEYLRNMGVGASMSVSIVRDGRLWGLIACHHAAPLYVPFEARMACEVFGQVLAVLIDTRREAALKQYLERTQRFQSQLIEEMVYSDDFADGLLRHPDMLREIVGAGGAALVTEEHGRLVGETPDAAAVQRLATWLDAHMEDDLFHTDALSRHLPEAVAFEATGSGILAISLSRLKRYYLIWFRPEQPRTVKWAGNPDKAVGRNGVPPADTGVTGHPGNDLPRLHPRKSFDTWKSVLRGRAEPWDEGARAAAHRLRAAIIDVVFVKTEQLAHLNAQLTDRNVRLEREITVRQQAEHALEEANKQLIQRNDELQDFAYVASHDLQEPLRKIQAFGSLLAAQFTDELSVEAQGLLHRMQSAAGRMSHLIRDLLAFSRVATLGSPPKPTDLNALLAQVQRDLRDVVQQTSAHIEVADLPPVLADAEQMHRLFERLLGNALKFRAEGVAPHIRVAGAVVSTEAGPRCRITVTDNGIGFDVKYLDRIFLPFQRLHPRGDYPGTGIGLAICRRIVDRHHGTLTAQSTPGRGSTFVVELPAAG